MVEKGAELNLTKSPTLTLGVGGQKVGLRRKNGEKGSYKLLLQNEGCSFLKTIGSTNVDRLLCEGFLGIKKGKQQKSHHTALFLHPQAPTLG